MKHFVWAALFALSGALSGCTRPNVETAPAPLPPPIASAVAVTAPSVSPSPAPIPSGPAPDSYLGRPIAKPMSYLGSEWLDRPDRADTEQPDKVIDALHLVPGNVVADVGAGTGYFSLRIARKVGPGGKVIATDIQPQMLKMLEANAKTAHVDNVTTVLCTETDAKLPVASVDLALMVDVYHELSRPAETLAQVRVALKPGGRLALVEYRGEDPSVPIKPEHKTTLPQLRLELDRAGFALSEDLEFLKNQRVVIFVPK
ncbi:MAG: methyltransferase domain-containing protein [Polyangiaceae bacterium]